PISIGPAAAVANASGRRVVIRGGRLLNDVDLAAAAGRDANVATHVRQWGFDAEPAARRIVAVDAVRPQIAATHGELNLTIHAAAPREEGAILGLERGCRPEDKRKGDGHHTKSRTKHGHM